MGDQPANNEHHFSIPSQAIDHTERVLRAYGDRRFPHEGFVYWGGTKKYDTSTIELVIAPHLEARFAGVRISAKSNASVVRELSNRSLTEVAQVHTHPTDWVDHSCGDDRLAPFRIGGLISIVVPNFCKHGMLPLRVCGIHRFTINSFERLSDFYVTKYFHVTHGSASFCDLR
jgi:hypothetical protein